MEYFMMEKNKLNLFALSFLTCLTACGGGGSGGGSSTASSTMSLPVPSNSSSVIASSSSVATNSSSELISSSVSSANSSVAISPLPSGSGTLATRFVVGGTYSINETTGILISQTNSLAKNYRAADIDPDGYVIATGANDTSIDKIDLISGAAQTLFNAPEKLSAIAVAPDNTIVGISSDEEFGKKSIYRFSKTGTLLSKVASDDVNPAGIDFDKDGYLYGIDLFGTWLIDPVGGKSTSKFAVTPSGQNDIDIDAQGMLRVISSNTLLIFDLINGQKVSEITLQHDYFAFSPIVHQPSAAAISSSSVSSSSVSSAPSQTNSAPTAHPGMNQSVNLNTTVNLNGSQSTDAEHDGLTYSWAFVSKPAGSMATLDNATVIDPTFLADISGTYVLSLVVNDGLLDSTPVNVQINVVQPSVSLYKDNGSFLGSAFGKTSFPYSSNNSLTVSVSGIPAPTTYKLDSFKLKAEGQTFTITDLTATDTTSRVAPYFSGISEGMQLAEGTEITFDLVSPLTQGATTSLNFSFQILETGQTFTALYTFKSN